MTPSTVILPMVVLLETLLQLHSVEGICSSKSSGSLFTKWTGIIQSPNFNNGKYLNSQVCEWRIRVSAGSKVKLTFRHFELEVAQSSGKCWDYIEINDGPENHRTRLAKICGRNLPAPILSNTNEVDIMFHTDNSKVYLGFEIEYIGVCEATITEPKATIESPGFPKLPPLGVVCKWTLQGRGNSRPAVEVTSIKHSFRICRHSGIKITDLPERDRVHYLCMNHSGRKFPSGQAMQISYDPREANRITKFILNVTHVGPNPCKISPCLNEGNCLDFGNIFNCVCPPGFSGETCQVDIDECASNPCQNNGVCKNLINGYVCTCPYDYTGPTCGSRLSTCHGISCLNGGKCVEFGNGNYQCKCVRGYTGPSCENRTDGVVMGLSCENVRCWNGGTCQPTKKGGFVCKCPPGVMGPYCDVSNGCVTNPCAADATCVTATNGRHVNDNDNSSGFKCLCPEGRIGHLCEDYVNHCLKNECHNGGLCVSIKSEFYCNCTSGWTGRLCEHDIDECLDSPCENEGQCENTYGSYSCDCKKGFTGYNCSTNLNDCTANACQHGGKCIDLINNYKCNCPENFWGKQCQHKRYPCDHQPCKNGGQCVSYKTGFICECLVGFTGKTCTDHVDQCRFQPCENNGKCVREDGSINYHCDCPTGFLGTHCELKNECFPNPCLNEGRCLEQLGFYSCKCRTGFNGNHCQFKEQNCDPDPCTHGGRCENLIGAYQCHCTDNYAGQKCTQFRYTNFVHCPEEVDQFNGSGIPWFATRIGHRDIQPCPPGILGNATRECYEDFNLPEGRPLWGRPDLTDCVHKEFLDLKKKVEHLLQAPYLSSRNVTDVTRGILNTIKNKTDDKIQLYPGDLVVTVDTSGLLADAISRTSDDDEDLQPIVEVFGETMGSIVDPTIIPVWRNANPNLVGEKMASVLSNTERLAGNVFQKRDRADTRSYSMASSNIDFSVTSLEEIYPEEHSVTSDTSSITLPKEIFDISQRESSGVPVGLFNARFSSIGEIMSYKNERPNSINDTRIINSDIITSSVIGVSQTKFVRLSSPVVLIFQLKDENHRNRLNESCVYMNMNATNLHDRWQYSGCYLAKQTPRYTECHCYHMTNFALLMDVHGIGARIANEHQIALSYISYIGGALSILGCVLSVVAFEYFRLSSDRVRIHENLAVSIILVQLIFLIGIDHKENPVACKAVAIFLHYVMIAMFCWMLVEGIHLYIVLVKVFKTGSHLKKYTAIGWGLPLVIVGIPVGLAFDKYGEGNICWMTSSSLLMLFVPTVALVIVLNTIVLAIVIRVMLRSFRSSHRAIAEETSAIRVGLKATAVLLPLLGLTWTFGFLSVDSSSTLMFTYVFTILNCLQGLFFFIFHCLMNIDVRNAIKRRYCGRKRSTLSAGRKSSVDFDTYGEFSSGGKKLVRDSSTSVMTNTTDLSSFERKRATLSEKHPNLLNKSTSNGDINRNGNVSNSKGLKLDPHCEEGALDGSNAEKESCLPQRGENDQETTECDTETEAVPSTLKYNFDTADTSLMDGISDFGSGNCDSASLPEATNTSNSNAIASNVADNDSNGDIAVSSPTDDVDNTGSQTDLRHHEQEEGDLNEILTAMDSMLEDANKK